MTSELTSETIATCRLPGYGAIVAINDVGAILYASDELERLLGLEPDSLVGRSFLEFVHGDDIEQAVVSFGGVGRQAGCHQALEIRVTNGADAIDVGVVADNRLDDPAVAAVLLHLAEPDPAVGR